MGEVGAQARPSAEVVGRDAEEARVAVFLSTLPGGVRALLLRGEPGIGKTAVWRRAVEESRRRGYHVLLARPAEEEMSLPVGGLVDLFEEDAIDTATLEAEDAHFARGRAVLTALRQLVESRPVVIAIDDLQWLDAASARALRYALRRVDLEPIGVLASIRAPHAPGDPLAASSTLPPGRSETLDLGPLGLGAMRRLLSPIVSTISRPILQRIYDVSGGNPLYAIELARFLARDERLRVSDDLPLPTSLQSAIARRLETVPVELVPLLDTISALGRSSVGELRRAFRETDVDTLLALAVAQELVVVGDDLEVRFSHPLIGSAVYGRMTPLGRRALHARLAGETKDPDLRARHLALSTDEPDDAVASLLESAAARALDRGAVAVAAEFAGHSRRLTPPDRADDARRRALTEIEHRAAAGEVSRALKLADRLIGELPPGPRRAEALVQRAALEDRDRVASVGFLEQALADVAEDERLRARLLVALVNPRALFLGDPAGAIDCGRQALEIAARLGDDSLWIVAAAHLGYVEALAGAPDPARLVEAVEIEERIGGPPLTEGPRVMLGKQRLWGGELEAARTLFEEAYAHDVRLGNERQRPYRLYDLALAEIAAGNLLAAQELARRAGQSAQDAEDSFAARLVLVPRGLIEAWLGAAADARDTADRLLAEAREHEAAPGQVFARKIRGLVALSEGKPAEAARELTAAADLHHGLGIRHPGAFAVLPDAIEAAAAEGDLKTARRLLGRLLEQAAALNAPWPDAAAAGARGALLLAEGDDGAAAVLFEAAASFDRLGYRPDAARVRLLAGSALLRTGQRSRAADGLADAHDRFAALGASLWQARAAAELERASPGRASGELTTTESRIAELVARGMRNREIGQALYVSVPTVEAHLTRIYRKLDIRSRTELARLVVEGSVVLQPGES